MPTCDINLSYDCYFCDPAIEFSDELMEKSVALITQLNSLVTQCDAYVQGHFDSPGISQPDLFER